jgi:hypothetical protein
MDMVSGTCTISERKQDHILRAIFATEKLAIGSAKGVDTVGKWWEKHSDS